MQPSKYAFFKGNFVPFEQATVSIMNQTFMYGIGVFEGIRGYYNQTEKQVYLFRLREHVDRLLDNIKILHLKCTYSPEQICDLVVELIKRNEPTSDMYIRAAVYAATNAIGPCLTSSESELCILTLPFGDYVDTSSGLKVQVSNWRRIEDNAIPARAKIIGAYVNTALAKTDAVLAGFDECITLSESGHVTEGSAMNLFMVKRGQLVTSPITENILEGITRATIIDMAREDYNINTCDRQIDRSELYTADELFFCGTGAQVAPIVSVDSRPIGNGKPGPISEKIKERYIDLCRGNVPKYKQWLTPVFDGSTVVAPAPAPISTVVG